MPRKPHRPPTTVKRRKSKRTSTPIFEEAPEATTNGATTAATAEDTTPVVEAATVSTTTRSLDSAPRPSSGKHIVHDYGYVRNEVLRIVTVAGFLIVALVITAILRG